MFHLAQEGIGLNVLLGSCFLLSLILLIQLQVMDDPFSSTSYERQSTLSLTLVSIGGVFTQNQAGISLFVGARCFS